MKSRFWKSDWFWGLAVIVLMLFAGGRDLLQSHERKAYEMGLQATARVPSDRIAVIAIDDASIANVGRWTWPRDVHAKMADLLAAAKAKVGGNSVFFSEPQIDPGYRYVAKLLEMATVAAASGGTSAEMTQFVATLREAFPGAATAAPAMRPAGSSGTVDIEL